MKFWWASCWHGLKAETLPRLKIIITTHIMITQNRNWESINTVKKAMSSDIFADMGNDVFMMCTHVSRLFYNVLQVLFTIAVHSSLLNFRDLFKPAWVPGETNVPHFSLMEVIKVEKKMNRSLFSVLTLMASLSSRNITLFVIIFFLIWVMIQRHLLPQVDLDVLIYDRFLLRYPVVASSINARWPNVLKTKPECNILAKDWKVWLTNIKTLWIVIVCPLTFANI